MGSVKGCAALCMRSAMHDATGASPGAGRSRSNTVVDIFTVDSTMPQRLAVAVRTVKDDVGLRESISAMPRRGRTRLIDTA